MAGAFEESLSRIAEGQYAIGVSGGADSVALLRLVMEFRPDLGVHLVHLNHEARGEESEGDARFVVELAARFKLPFSISRRSEIEPTLKNRPGNLSALFRAMRIELFRRVCGEHRLHGVLLAHHRDDQAETILHRLLRGSGMRGLAGMSFESRQGQLLMLRPLLAHGREELREYLRAIGQDWREDSSNQSAKYLRNRLRRILNKEISQRLVEVAEAMRELRRWTRENAPRLEQRFFMKELEGLPSTLAEESARIWLIDHGAPASELSANVLERFVKFATDAASANKEMFPGRIQVVRRRGWIELK